MQNNALSTIALLMATAGVLAYGWSPNALSRPLTAILTNAKPAEVTELAAPQRPVSIISGSSVSNVARSPIVQAPPSLPSEYSKLTPLADIATDTSIRNLTFSTAVSEDLRPLGRYTVFSEGFYTLYATFSYENMVEGTTWSWVWRHNGEAVGGGEQRWTYGEEGPGYVYFEPETGFSEGMYSLELWVNGELFSSSDVEVSGNVANQ